MRDEHEISLVEAQEWLAAQAAVLIDVREAGEFDEIRIPGAVNQPVSSFDTAAVLELAGERKIIFSCRSGPRADNMHQLFVASTGRPAFCLQGSIMGWQAAGLPLEYGAQQPQSMQQQGI